MPENLMAEQMKFIGLLTSTQKQSGYFVSQDDDFVWLWKAKNGKPDIVATFLYDTVTIKQVREAAQSHLEETNAKIHTIKAIQAIKAKKETQPV